MDVVPRLPPWWLDEAGADEPAPALEGDAQADVCIVGGGFTGLWTALAVREREPSARVVVLEADRCGVGPSGRNGGFVHGYWAGLSGARAVVGSEGALAVARAGERIIPAVRALGADVWLRESGMLMVSSTRAQDSVIDAGVRAADELGAAEHAVPLGEAEVAARIRSPVFRRGVFFPECATVQPARLVAALRRAALDAGVELHEGTRAERGLRRLLPGLAAARVEHAWGGPIDVSADHLPFFGTVPGTRIHYGLGYSGHGVGPSWLGGQILASLAAGLDDEWTQLPLATRC